MNGPKFQILHGHGKQFRIVFDGGNNEVVLVGENCKNHQDVLDTIAMIKREAPNAPIEDLTKKSK